MKILKLVLNSFMLILFIACNDNESIETDLNDDTSDVGGDVITGDDVIKATKATVYGNTVATGSDFNTRTYDLDKNHSNDYIEIENYDSSYTYQLKLTGDLLKNEYTVDLTEKTSVAVAESPTNITPEANTLAPISNTFSQEMTMDVETLDMIPDIYTGIILEKNSSNELTINANLSTFVGDVKFLDQRSSTFLATFRASENGVTKSSGQNINSGVDVSFYNLETARAFTSYGFPHMAFYDSDLTLIGRTTSKFSSASSSGFDFTFNTIYNSYYTTIDYLSPKNASVTTAGNYYIR